MKLWLVLAGCAVALGQTESGADSVPDKCSPVADSTCSANPQPICTPWRSPEHCDPQISFPTLVSSRWQMIKESRYGDSDILGDDGWWFHYTDDRAGAYAFTSFNELPAPPLLCCVTSVNELFGPPGNPAESNCFDGSPVAWGDAYVIRADGHHSSKGIFVLPTGLDNIGGTAKKELLGGNPVTIEQVRGYLKNLVPKPRKIVVEKFIAGSGEGETATFPNEYKFHMFNGKIGSISTFMGRGTGCACYGEYSEDWESLHKNGCFVPSLPMGLIMKEDPNCYMIDFGVGNTKPYAVKGFDLCGPVPRPPACVFETMKDFAVKLSTDLGVYVRIDMFVTDKNEIYVQEYSFNHLGGSRHCASRETDSGCIDSCMLGRCWQDAVAASSGNAEMGGPKTNPPPIFASGYSSFPDGLQCVIAFGQTPSFSGNVCGLPTVAPTTLAPSVAPVDGARRGL